MSVTITFLVRELCRLNINILYKLYFISPAIYIFENAPVLAALHFISNLEFFLIKLKWRNPWYWHYSRQLQLERSVVLIKSVISLYLELYRQNVSLQFPDV